MAGGLRTSVDAAAAIHQNWCTPSRVQIDRSDCWLYSSNRGVQLCYIRQFLFRAALPLITKKLVCGLSAEVRFSRGC